MTAPLPLVAAALEDVTAGTNITALNERAVPVALIDPGLHRSWPAVRRPHRRWGTDVGRAETYDQPQSQRQFGRWLVVSEHGRGVYVRPRPPVRRLAFDRFARRHREQGKSAFIVEADAAGSHPTVDGLEVREERPAPEIATRLGSPRRVLARRRRYLLDGRPMEFATSYVPLDIARDTPIAQPDPGPGGIYARLEEMGHCLDHFEEEIQARMPSPQETKVLQLAAGVPVIHLVRIAFDMDGRAVEVCDTIMAADAYVLSYRLPAN
ncbi:GntR family transcriptional regulator [Peterkaempfera bronchialis]|uniref:GntR family transcriptional regulator n=1 Tax=Peterkaempfera bronchialis TaxID=2126346 RepID=UPI003C2FE250